MAEDDDTSSNEQKAVAKGKGSLAINAARYANVTVYQYVTYSGDRVTIRETTDPSRCPYPGLETFRTSEAAFFAGREDDVAELEAKLRDHDICGVIAASGAGKSSLVHAGLIPALAARETEAWDIFAFKPGQEPLYGLARSLSGVLAEAETRKGQFDEIDATVADLRETPGRLKRYIEDIISRRADAADGKHHHVLIFIDQWEELYTRENDQDRDILVRELMDVAERGLAKVLLTMRIDFMEEMLLLSTDFFRSLKPGIHYVEPMGETGLRSAIEVPAGEVGLGVPEALTSRLIADLGSGRDHGSLPYLQFVLRQLWENRDQTTNSLTTEAYDEMKGLQGAIGAHADAVFGRLTKEEQALAQRVLPRLANVSEVGAITSRRLPFADFDEPARDLLRKLAEPKRRLIVLSSATEEVAEAEIVAEVAHEALLDDWRTLSGWITDRKDFFRLRNKLEADAKAWVENDRDRSFLTLKGKALSEALDLKACSDKNEISTILRAFINSCLWRDRLGKGILVFVSTGVIAGSIAAAIYSTHLTQIARRESAFLQLSIAESEISEGRNTEALVRLIAADEVLGFLDGNGFDAASNARNLVALALDRQREILRIHGNYTSVAISPDETIFLGGPNGEVSQYEISTGEKLETFALGEKEITSIEVSTLGNVIAATDDDNTIHLRSLVGSSEFDKTWRSVHFKASGLSLSNDGSELLIYASRIPGLMPVLGYWTKGADTISILKSHCGGGARISGDGGEFGALEAGQNAVIYTLPDEAVLEEFPLGTRIADGKLDYSCEPAQNYRCAWFSQDLGSVVAWAGPTTISRFSLNESNQKSVLTDLISSLVNQSSLPEDGYYFDCRLSVSPSGNLVAVNHDEVAWRVFEFTNGSVQVSSHEPILSFRGIGTEVVWGHTGTDASSPVEDITLLDDHRALLFFEEHVSLIELNRELSRFEISENELTSISFSYSDSYLTAASQDGFVTVIDVQSGEQMFRGFPLGEREIDKDNGFIASLSVSDDGKSLLIGTVSGSAYLVKLSINEDKQSEQWKLQSKYQLTKKGPLVIAGFLGDSNVFALASEKFGGIQIIDPSIGMTPIQRIPVQNFVIDGLYHWRDMPIYSDYFSFQPETKSLTMYTYSDWEQEIEIDTESDPVSKLTIDNSRSNLHASFFNGTYSLGTGPTVVPSISLHDDQLLVNRSGLKSPGEGNYAFVLREFRPNGLEPAGAMAVTNDDRMVWMATRDGELVAYSLEFLSRDLRNMACDSLPVFPENQFSEFTRKIGIEAPCSNNRQ